MDDRTGEIRVLPICIRMQDGGVFFFGYIRHLFCRKGKKRMGEGLWGTVRL